MPTSNSNSGKGRKISLPLCLPSNSRAWRDKEASIVGQNTTVELTIFCGPIVKCTETGMAEFRIVQAEKRHAHRGVNHLSFYAVTVLIRNPGRRIPDALWRLFKALLVVFGKLL